MSKSRSRNDSKKVFPSRYCGGSNHYERDCKEEEEPKEINNKKNDFITSTCDGDILLPVMILVIV